MSDHCVDKYLQKENGYTLMKNIRHCFVTNRIDWLFLSYFGKCSRLERELSGATIFLLLVYINKCEHFGQHISLHCVSLVFFHTLTYTHTHNDFLQMSCINMTHKTGYWKHGTFRLEHKKIERKMSNSPLLCKWFFHWFGSPYFSSENGFMNNTFE